MNTFTKTILVCCAVAAAATLATFTMSRLQTAVAPKVQQKASEVIKDATAKTVGTITEQKVRSGLDKFHKKHQPE
jgi:FlaG/FlaF family flagellin (archaellin)